MKKLISTLFALIFLSLNAIIACASPQKAQGIDIRSFNFTQDCKYIDLLIQMSEDENNYIAYNETNMKQCTFDTRELSHYCDNGYVSMSCHYKDNYTELIIKKKNAKETIFSVNCFVLDKDYDGDLRYGFKRMSDLYNRSPKPKFKIAVLDKNGSIIQTSESFEIVNDSGYLYGNVNYDIKNNRIELDWEKQLTPTQFAILYYGIVIVGSIGIVALTAKIGLFFVNRKKRRE